jgi:hypothetical protein
MIKYQPLNSELMIMPSKIAENFQDATRIMIYHTV